MKKYSITLTAPNSWDRVFQSNSRNARRHLADHFGGTFGARCYVRDLNGNTVSACMYTAERGGQYVYILAE